VNRFIWCFTFIFLITFIVYKIFFLINLFNLKDVLFYIFWYLIWNYFFIWNFLMKKISLLNKLILYMSPVFAWLGINSMSEIFDDWLFVEILINNNNWFLRQTVTFPVFQENIYIDHTQILLLLLQCSFIYFTANIVLYIIWVYHFSQKFLI
jgi:hypothetical protein